MDPRELRVVGTHSCRYCALSGLGGRDITGGLCFKNPTGGDFRRTERDWEGENGMAKIIYGMEKKPNKNKNKNNNDNNNNN